MQAPEEDLRLRTMMREASVERSEASILREGLHYCAQHNESLLLEIQKLRLENSMLQEKLDAYEKKPAQTKEAPLAKERIAPDVQIEEHVEWGLHQAPQLQPST